MSVFATDPHRIIQFTRLTLGGGENAEHFVSQLYRNPTVERLDQLLSQFPDFDLSRGGQTEDTVLSIAIRRGSLPLIRRILELRPDLVNKPVLTVEDPFPPLWMAAEHEDAVFSLAAVEELLKRGADVNLACLDGVTPLFRSALKADHIAVTRALLERGGVIYQAARKVWPLSKRGLDAIAAQPANIAAALEGVSHFARGQLFDPDHPMNRLPAGLCKEIASFVVPREYL